MDCDCPETVAFAKEEIAEIGVAELDCICQHRFKYRLKLAD
jgi:hypothetical protein